MLAVADWWLAMGWCGGRGNGGGGDAGDDDGEDENADGEFHRWLPFQVDLIERKRVHLDGRIVAKIACSSQAIFI